MYSVAKWPVLTVPTLPPIKDSVSPVAMTFAFLLAPVAVAAVGFWAIFIPVFALFFGYLPYLILGLPLILAFAGRINMTARAYAVLGLSGFTIAMLLWCLTHITVDYINGASTVRLPDLVPLYAIFGLVFAPLWAGTIPVLYNAFTKKPVQPAPEPQKGKEQ
ncbi:MAG: hypothetical protein ACPG5U_05520 [Planktomarina sp.]